MNLPLPLTSAYRGAAAIVAALGLGAIIALATPPAPPQGRPPPPA